MRTPPISRTPANRLSARRIDAEYYGKEHLKDEEILEAYGSTPLGKFGKLFAGPFGSKVPNSKFVDEGVPLFRVSNIGWMEIIEENLAKIPESLHQEIEASEVLPGDLLIVKASVGEKIAVLPDYFEKANITQHIIGLRPREGSDTCFLAAFLMAQYGRRQLERRSLGAIIQYLGVVDARTVLVPKADPKAQKYIGDKVRQAERLRGLGNGLLSNIEFLFKSLTSNLIKRKKSWRTISDELSPYRINPIQYDPVVKDMLRQATSICKLTPLEKIIDSRGISGGATPLGATYLEQGIFFARVQNIGRYCLDRSDAAYISSETDLQIKRSRCRAKDIILSITGYPGTASLVVEDDLPVNINQHSVRFGVKEPWLSGFVAAAINSRFVKLQVDSLVTGGTREALDYPSVKSLLIPSFPTEKMKLIDMSVNNYIRSIRAAEKLIAAAKFFVEALIEPDNSLTEKDLIEAYENPEADRTLMERLKVDGFDGEGDPLFPDLDTLADLITKATDPDPAEA